MNRMSMMSMSRCIGTPAERPKSENESEIKWAKEINGIETSFETSREEHVRTMIQTILLSVCRKHC